jgi:putative toxin-antitoxin system antitoxin component (TIGR02293 family)
MAHKDLRLEIVPGPLQGVSSGSRRPARFSEGRWVVPVSADALSHYISVVGNLTSQAAGASAPAFQYVRSVVKEGLPRSAFDRVKGAVGVSSEGLSSLTGIPLRTLSRRRKLKPDESERLLRVASAFQKAVELFRDLEKARAWFTSPKPALAGLAPLQCCDTETGSREVENLLGRVDESVYW